MAIKSKIKKLVPRPILQLYWKIRYPDFGNWWKYLTSPAPLNNFHKDYDQYWRIRGDIKTILNRWRIAETQIEDEGSLLEIGCGSGEFLTYLQGQKPNLKIEAIDISEVAVERTHKRGFPARVADLTRQTLPQDYDYMTCFEVLEHVPEAEAMMSEMLRHVRKKLIVSMPNVGCLRCRARLALFGRFPITMIVLHMKEHVRFWTVKDFHEWVRHLGGEVVGIYGQYGGQHLPWKKMPGLFAWGLVYVIEPKPQGRLPDDVPKHMSPVG